MRFFILIASIFLCSNAIAQNITTLPPRLQAFIDNLTDVTASFVQTKQLNGYKIKFRSEGRVSFSKLQGLHWQIIKPMPMDFISTSKKYCVNGDTKTIKYTPQLAYATSAMKEVLTGNLNSLTDVFALDYIDNIVSNDLDNSLWQLNLTALDKDIKQFIKSIEIFGDDKIIHKVILNYTNQDIVTIKFKDVIDGISHAIKCP